LQADIGVVATQQLLDALRDHIKLKGLKTADEVREALRDELAKRLKPNEATFAAATGAARPHVVMVAGVNGAGKTTSIGKLAHWLADRRRSVLLAAGDTFRAAAREQLAVWGQRNGVEVIAQASGDPAAVVFDAVRAAQARNIDVLIADTAGRLPTQLHLMDELKRVKRSLTKAMDSAPHDALLVIDGTNGQNALAQVKAFDEAIGLTGLIVTKLDGTAKGGVLAAIAALPRAQPLPILFIGVGEKLEDLQPVVAREFAEALIG
jgi:fused signal recognition particle receptor